MISIAQATTSHIRKVNVRRDLQEIADLIELCFAATLDDDGRDYLRHLRTAARDMAYLSWLQSAAERIATPLYGYVWEEDNRIIGNLSLVPMTRFGRITYLIANVAVHPQYRRRGIGRQLTQTAIDHLRRRGIESAWLQVRDDNPVAVHLYQSLGFQERARRTTWQSSASPAQTHLRAEGVTVHKRKLQDWGQQSALLQQIYPPEVAWNLPIKFSRLSPSPLNQVLRWLQNEPQQSWTARSGETPIGYLTWEPSRSSSDCLWLAAEPQHDEAAILSLLPHARRVLSRRGRPLSVNYPAGRGSEAFLRAGFAHHQTLIWMEVPLLTYPLKDMGGAASAPHSEA